MGFKKDAAKTLLSGIRIRKKKKTSQDDHFRKRQHQADRPGSQLLLCPTTVLGLPKMYSRMKPDCTVKMIYFVQSSWLCQKWKTASLQT